MGADFGKSRGEGDHTENPFCGGGGGMDIFWNDNKNVRMQKGATFTVVSTLLLIGLNIKF